MISKELEYRFAEFWTEGDGGAGVVMPYGRQANIGSFTEEFRAGAFGQLGDVVLNLQQQRAKPVARTGAGLELLDEPVTLRAAIEFRATQDEWQGTHRIFHAASLYGVALVDRPATRTNACARTDRTCPGGCRVRIAAFGRRAAGGWRNCRARIEHGRIGRRPCASALPGAGTVQRNAAGERRQRFGRNPDERIND